MSVTGEAETRSRRSGYAWLVTVMASVLVGLVGTFVTARTALGQSRFEADRELKTKLIEMLSEHLVDDDPTLALSLIDMLDTVDSEYAARIRMRIGEPTGWGVIPGSLGGVSPALRIAVRTEVSSAPWPFEEKPEWYAVLASFDTKADAFRQMANASKRLGDAAREQFASDQLTVKVFLAANGRYALTLGGKLEGYEQAQDYADFARVHGDEFRFAYPWQTAQAWTHIPF